MNDTAAYAVEQTDCELIRKIDRTVSMAEMDDEWRHAAPRDQWRDAPTV